MIRPFRFDIGPYSLLLPGGAIVESQIRGPTEAHRRAWTNWIINVGRFRIFAHLDALQGLIDLKAFIDHQTKDDVVTPSLAVNGISGVTHGDYGPPRTWIDWWFKRETQWSAYVSNLRNPLSPIQRLKNVLFTMRLLDR